MTTVAASNEILLLSITSGNKAFKLIAERLGQRIKISPSELLGVCFFQSCEATAAQFRMHQQSEVVSPDIPKSKTHVYLLLNLLLQKHALLQLSTHKKTTLKKPRSKNKQTALHGLGGVSVAFVDIRYFAQNLCAHQLSLVKRVQILSQLLRARCPNNYEGHSCVYDIKGATILHIYLWR